MSFLSPLLLFGLLAALLPPLIHLLNRREPRPTPFAALELLRRAHQRTARRVKLKQWLLIALRALLLATLALAMARPYWQPQVEQAEGLKAEVSGDGLSAQVIVFDTSYMMGLKVSNGEHLIDLARSHALSTLSDAQAEVGLVLVGEGVSAPLGGPSASTDALRERVLALKPSERHTPLSEGVLKAYELLRELSPATPKRVVILSAPHRARASLPSPPPELGATTLTPIDLLAGLTNTEGALNNHALTAVSAQPAPQRGADQWRVDVEVANWSDQAMELWPVWVEVEGEVKVRGFVTLAPGEVGQKRLYFKANVETSEPTASGEGSDARERGAPRGLRGRVRLGADALPIDDTRAFWLSPAPPTRLLALNGDPRPIPQEDELFYMRSALAPEVTGAGRFELRALPSSGEALSDEDLLWADVVVLANVGRVSEVLGRQLTELVVRGGGLLLAPGERSTPRSWNRSLKALLPRPLRGPRRSGDAAAHLQDRRAARLSEFKEGHPLFAPFSDPLRSTLAKASLERYMLFDPQPPPKSEVIASLNEGSPYLMSRSHGEGRVLMIGGPLDRAWSDLVLKPDFVPLTQQLVRYLTQRGPMESVEAGCGEALTLTLSGVGPFSALSPQGERAALTQRSSEGRLWSLPNVSPLGHHRVLNEASEEVGRFVVNLNAEASDLRLSASPQRSTQANDEKVSLSARRAERTHLWPFALFGLFVLLALEAFTLYQRPARSAR